MKNKNTWYFAILLSMIGIVFTNKAIAQLGGPTTPNAIFDTIFDKDGNKYLLKDLKVNYTPNPGGSTGKVSAAITSSCSAGYFNLYYESGSLGTGTVSPTQQAANQAVICQVFTDISNFITSPLNNAGNTTKVNIWVRDPVNVYAPTPVPSGLLGSASQYYSMPSSNSISGIVDGEIYKTIISGIDSYSNVASPIFVSSGGASSPSGDYFHGMVNFNFNSINWCTTMTTTPTASQYDLYSVALHEVTHALGFASLINFNGNSLFGLSFPYFSRYDLFLKKGTTPLIVNTGGCNLYNYQFNSASLSPTVITPGCTITPTPTSSGSNSTSCGSSLTYSGSVNVPIYTPSCYEAGSSLSHFEDMCYPTPSTPYGNDLYFVMSNANGSGISYMKRYLKPEERSVLCDLGYNVKPNYGSTSVAQGTFAYGGSACPGIGIIGVNDGFTGGSYTWFTNTNTLTIPISQVVANDYNAISATNPTSLTCAEIVYGTGTLATTVGNLVFTPTGGYTGLVLLRYVPYNGNKYGNITYIYGFITPAGCTPVNPCDIVQNGGFESIQSVRQCGDGWPNTTNNLALNCWFALSQTSDLFGTGCTNASSSSAPSATTSINSYNLGTNTCHSSPTFSAPYTSTTSTQNNHVIGFAHLYEGPFVNNLVKETMCNYLSSPLVNGQAYKLSFWAYNYSGLFSVPDGVAAPTFPASYITFTMNPNQNPSVFSIASSSLTTLAFNSGIYATTAASTITDTPIFSYTNTTINAWQYVSTTFTYTGTNNGNLLVLGGDIFANFTSGYYGTAKYFHYNLIDDISILPISSAPSFSLPTTVYCNTTNTVTNMGQYATPPGGSFSGPGVTNTSGQYNFSPQAAGIGNHNLIYTYVSPNNCTYTAVQQVTVSASNGPTVTATANPTLICSSKSTTLTASGATSYTWSSSANTATTVVSPTVTTTYTVTGRNSSGCTNTQTVTVIVIPFAPVISASAAAVAICSGGATTITASGAATYTWNTGATTSAISVTPAVVTSYTVSGNYSLTGCGTGSTTIVVNPIISTLCCSAATSTLGTSLTSSVSAAAGSYTTSADIIYVQGVVTYTGNTSYIGYTFRMAPGALIRVNPNQTLTLTNCKLFSCSELWDGILLREDDLNFGNLVLNNTTIEDMYNGIVVDYDNHTINSSAPSGSITINASKLNKNYISFQMRNSSGMSNGTGNYPFSITSSTISSATSTTSPGSSLKPSSTYTYAYNTITNGSTGTSAPYVNFPRAFTGIQLSNLGYLCSVNIGSRTSSTLTNTFNNLDFGVNGTEVYTKVYNNYFKNITGSVKSLDPSPLGPPPAQGPDEIGIAVCITQTTTANYNTCIVGANPTLPTITNPYPDGNLFEDCNRGVKTTNNRYVTVIGNVFNTTTTSIPVSTSSGYPPMFVINPNTYYYYTGQNAVWSSALGTKADLSYNLIRNHNTGVYDSHSINPTISGTVIVQGNDISAPSSTGYCKQAIQIDQAGGTNIPTDQAYIANNRLEKIYRGVVSNGVLSGLLIKGNMINLEGVAKTLNYTAASQRTGVSLTSCQYASVKGNSFTQNGSVPTTTVTALAINGVYLKNSPYGKTECNTATNLGRCFVFEGTCDNSWKVNNMSNSFIGMEIRVLGRIGIQGALIGSPGNPNLSANTWTTITRETNILNSANNNTISPLYVLAGTGTQPTLNFGTAGHTYSTSAIQGIRVQSSGTSYTCNAGSAQRMSGGDNNGNNKQTAEIEDSLTDYISLAQSNENTYDAFTDEFIYQNKQLVYKLMAADSLQVADGSTLDNFYQANQNTAIAQLTEVQKAINNDDIHMANSANASVSPSNMVEYKHQRANELILKYLADRFYVYADDEKQDLYNYANECVIKGYYVIQARNIINIITNQVVEYNDDCEAEASSQRKAKVQATGISNTSTFNLFPNPNNGKMQLDYNLGGYAKAEFKLFDITGKLISIKNMAENEGSLLITERNLSNGVYFYHILVGEKTIKTDKIVIIK